MNNIYKLIFFLLLMSGTLISISSSSWLSVWMGLEINLLSFIPLLKMNNNMNSPESSIKYFLIQALASMIFLFSIIIIMMTKFLIDTNYDMFIMMMMNSSILTKMGAPPFHFWFPEIIENMNWNNSLILLTWQKIAPMMIISYTIKISNFMIFIILMCSMIGSLGGLNQTSIRKIMAYSSINHMSWMISSFLMNEMMWILYFYTYTFITSTLIYMLYYYKIFYIKQLYMFMKMKIIIKFMLIMNFMSLGGLPPFMGFFPKWIIIQFMSNQYLLIIMIMILMTLITLFFYIRTMFTTLIMNHNNNWFNWMINNYHNNNMMMISSFLSISGLIFSTILFNYF